MVLRLIMVLRKACILAVIALAHKTISGACRATTSSQELVLNRAPVAS